PDSFFDTEPTFDLNEIRQIQAWIRVSAPRNSRQLQNANKERFARLLKRNRPVQDIRVNETRWVGTIYPTSAGAQDAGMSDDEFRRFAFQAMYLYDDDPAARWREQEQRQVRLVERLAEADEVRITAPGTDLRLSVKGRTWINSAGRRNMPCGE